MRSRALRILGLALAALLWLASSVEATFPVIQATNSGSEGTDTGTHTVNLPASIVSGEVLVVIFAYDEAPTLTWPAGWNSFLAFSSGTAWSVNVRYKVADGSEGASISVSSSTNQKSAHISYRISGADTTSAPEGLNQAPVNTINPNPPNLTPSWGAADTLWFAAAVVGGNAARTFTADPTSYTGGITATGGSDNTGVTMRALTRSLNATSEDPGAFGLDLSSSSAGITLAVEPGGAVAATPYRGLLGVGQ